jgi:hypothetical protein
MPQRYKVVKRKTRMSAVINGHSIYALKYLPDTKVIAKEGTLGVMTFKTRNAAEDWAYSMNYHQYSPYDSDALIVIMVETIGKGKIPEAICNKIDTSSLKQFYKYAYGNGYSPPNNTVCYPGVLVLE